jgi:hypothetical protein
LKDVELISLCGIVGAFGVVGLETVDDLDAE